MLEQQVQEFIEALTQYVQILTVNHSVAPWWEALLNSQLLGVVIGGVIASIPALLNAREERQRKQREKLEKQLELFYNPLLFLMARNRNLYKILKKQRPEETQDARTLGLLIDNAKLSDKEEIILQDILKNNDEIRALILKQSGLIQGEDLRNDLIQLVGHHDIIHLAKEHKLKGTSSDYADYVYPRNVDTKVENKVIELEKKIDELSHSKKWFWKK